MKPKLFIAITLLSVVGQVHAINADRCHLARIMMPSTITDSYGNAVANNGFIQALGMDRADYIRQFNDSRVLATRCLDASYRAINIDGVQKYYRPPTITGQVKGIENIGCWEWDFQYVCTSDAHNSCRDWDKQDAGDFLNRPNNWKLKGLANVQVIDELYKFAQNDVERDAATINKRLYFAGNEQWQTQCHSLSIGQRFKPLEDAHCELDASGNPLVGGCLPTPLKAGSEHVVDGLVHLGKL